MNQACTTGSGCAGKPPCDCCQGPRVTTPLPIYNRPGLTQLSYRIGSYATFFETMQARLASTDYPELAGLRTRETTDASMALLDAWATVADVLSFYQERIANEGYLRTATERRSVLELARLIGYALRPGVASSVYLAYSLAKDSDPVTILPGTRANSIPGPAEQMQAFETSDPLDARVEWNAITPRLTQPQTAASSRRQWLVPQGNLDQAQGQRCPARRLRRRPGAAADAYRIRQRGQREPAHPGGAAHADRGRRRCRAGESLQRRAALRRVGGCGHDQARAGAGSGNQGGVGGRGGRAGRAPRYDRAAQARRGSEPGRDCPFQQARAVAGGTEHGTARHTRRASRPTSRGWPKPLSAAAATSASWVDWWKN